MHGHLDVKYVGNTRSKFVIYYVFSFFVHCICNVFINQVRDDMRTAGVMPSEELISKPDSGERSPCSFDISKAEREVELWCWAKGYHPQTEAAVPEHAVDNCSNYGGSTEEVLPVNDTGTEPYNSDKQSFTWELNRCETNKKFSEREELWNYSTIIFYTKLNEVRWVWGLLKIINDFGGSTTLSVAKIILRLWQMNEIWVRSNGGKVLSG